jgi:hypothetical protein
VLETYRGKFEAPRSVGVVPEGLRSLSLLTHRSTTPTCAKPARFGDPGEAVGYLIPSRLAGLLLRAWALILPLTAILGDTEGHGG